MNTTWMTAAAVLVLAAAVMMKGHTGYFGSGHQAGGHRMEARA